jgi:hypothetical protein
MYFRGLSPDIIEFSISANANSPENSQKANLEVRVKGSQQNTEDDSNFVTILLQTFGVRVK